MTGTARRLFLQHEYEESKQDYILNWKTLDEVLYRICCDYPTHNDPAAVNAKIYIIGRTYTTGIERKVPTTGAQSSSMSQVAELFFKHRRDIDSWLVHLGKISEPLTMLKIRKIVLFHGLLVNRLTSITRNGQSTPSFVSKYLHFHNPVVPIYDSVAARILPSLVPLRTIHELKIRPVRCVDIEYADYVRRFFKLYQSQQHLSMTVRSLDYYLLWKADQGRPV
jgi:hypothetical protein